MRERITVFIVMQDLFYRENPVGTANTVFRQIPTTIIGRR